MNKSESKELGANKRPSARRPSAESDLPQADSTGTIAKRVHARRANPEPDPWLSVEPPEASGQSDEGIAFAAGTEPTVAASSVPPPVRARARRPARAKLASKASRAQPPAAEPTPTAAAEPGSAVDAEQAAAEPERAGPPPAAFSSPGAVAAVHADEPERAGPPTAVVSFAQEAPHATRMPAAAPPTAAAEPALREDTPGQQSAAAPPEAATIVEGPRWSASLPPAEEPPPVLDHADFADDFGLDLQYETKLRPWLDSLCERHFHVELHGAENIPAHGRALLVANHSRASVWDGIVLRSALRLHHPAGRVPRWLVDDQQFHAAFLGTIVNRLGAVRACQENAERLLLREELVAVFPEGSKATERPYEERYRLQRFGRGGYVKLALRTGTPVLPVAIVATEHEGAVWRNRLATASRVLSAPFAALRPGFPRIGMLGMPPISVRIRIYVGAAIDEISRQDASVTQDDGLVHELNECVRSAIQLVVNASLHA